MGKKEVGWGHLCLVLRAWHYLWTDICPYCGKKKKRPKKIETGGS